MKGILLTAAGFLFLLLGGIGLLLPVWPTTPFVLAAAGCLSGTSRVRTILTRLPFFREYLAHYTGGKGVSRRTVAVSLSFLWGMLLLSGLLVQLLWVRLLLVAVGAGVTVHILCMATPRRGAAPKERRGKKQ